MDARSGFVEVVTTAFISLAASAFLTVFVHRILVPD
jgi:hypothetical protein